MNIRSQNKGLPTTFNVTNGRFELIGGTIKCRDNMRMILQFCDWFRNYRTDFCIDTYWMLQKPTSLIETFKLLVLSQFITCAEKYAPFIKIRKSNIFYNNRQRKELAIGFEYSNNLEPEMLDQVVEILNP